jgi:hypothetical protein
LRLLSVRRKHLPNPTHSKHTQTEGPLSQTHHHNGSSKQPKPPRGNQCRSQGFRQRRRSNSFTASVVFDFQLKYFSLFLLSALQCLEALTLGMPFEVWKTRMGRYRNENTVSAFVNVYKAGGGGVRGVMSFWAGLGPKMVESASKGAVLLVSREGLLLVWDALLSCFFAWFVLSSPLLTAPTRDQSLLRQRRSEQERVRLHCWWWWWGSYDFDWSYLPSYLSVSLSSFSLSRSVRRS